MQLLYFLPSLLDITLIHMTFSLSYHTLPHLPLPSLRLCRRQDRPMSLSALSMRQVHRSVEICAKLFKIYNSKSGKVRNG